MHVVKAIIYTLLFFGILLINAALLLIVDFDDQEALWNNYIFFTAVFELLLVIIFLTITKYFDQSKFHIFNSKLLWLSIVLGVSFPFVQTPLNWLFNTLFNTNYFITYDFGGTIQTWPNIIAGIIIIPFAEEMFFKLSVQTELQKTLSRGKAILITASLFAFIHLPFVIIFIEPSAFEFHTAYIAFFIGLISSWLYSKSDNIWSSILMHMSVNLMVTLI
ncbi:CPBP family intramembrane glutamic endopeptidase [Fulvivirga lutea]|uniref:CPBP family intramembrane metalloprotease n=1 Tax=Fulvivirga lutea TaxID=2810512 RepID=A0A974WGZ1_9BACT|nr:type II CAAX endopeptidase family protein [Fulvivirga lutea]QSE95915.1 CPBP family intramembrane metalloprotease [Fulvivirga lutea]